MADKTGIEWTDSTWNPIRARSNRTGRKGWHCTKVSAECVHCYAEEMNRFRGTKLSYVHDADVTTFLDEKTLTQPLRWQRPRLIFPCSMTDLFGAFVTDDTLDRVWGVIARADRHVFQVLTKRAERMEDYLAECYSGRMYEIAEKVERREGIVEAGRVLAAFANELPHVWLGVSAGTQKMMDEQVPHLLRTPAAKRWLSMEPLLENVYPKLCSLCGNVTHDGCGEFKGSIDWVVVGGESGHSARPMHPEWARTAVTKCHHAGVPVLFKQWGQWVPVTIERDPEFVGGEAFDDPRGGRCAWLGDDSHFHRLSTTEGMVKVAKKDAGRELDGKVWDEYPEGFRVREWPEVAS